MQVETIKFDHVNDNVEKDQDFMFGQKLVGIQYDLVKQYGLKLTISPLSPAVPFSEEILSNFAGDLDYGIENTEILTK